MDTHSVLEEWPRFHHGLESHAQGESSLCPLSPVPAVGSSGLGLRRGAHCVGSRPNPLPWDPVLLSPNACQLLGKPPLAAGPQSPFSPVIATQSQNLSPRVNHFTMRCDFR